MNFLEHTNAWINGELLEAKLIILFSAIIILSLLLFRFWGTTANTQALVLPLLGVGLFFLTIGGSMQLNNSQRVQDYAAAFEANPNGFVKSEKVRVEAFTSWYPKTRLVFAILGIIGIIIFIAMNTPTARAIGIALLLATIGTFIVDHFSEERASLYYNEINNQISLLKIE